MQLKQPMQAAVLIAVLFMFIACDEKEKPKTEAANPYDSLIEKAKETEEVLQKRADSIIRVYDSLGIPY